jgi:hypothetical protein
MPLMPNERPGRASLSRARRRCSMAGCSTRASISRVHTSDKLNYQNKRLSGAPSIRYVSKCKKCRGAATKWAYGKGRKRHASCGVADPCQRSSCKASFFPHAPIADPYTGASDRPIKSCPPTFAPEFRKCLVCHQRVFPPLDKPVLWS